MFVKVAMMIAIIFAFPRAAAAAESEGKQSD
jgi:hypothetical protein